eukprot:COSAG01_NODE_60712_length_293_cov_0.804124_1_plen_42_part_10
MCWAGRRRTAALYILYAPLARSTAMILVAHQASTLALLLLLL